MLKKKFILLVFLITLLSISFISSNDINKINKEISLKKMDINLLKTIKEKENFENNNNKVFGVTGYETNSKISVIVLLNDNEDIKKFVVGLQKESIKIPFTFHLINGFVAQMDVVQIYDIAIDSRIKRIYLDKKVNMNFDDFHNIKDFKKQNEITLGEIENLSESAIQIGAQELWNAGFKGKDIKIAVLDTGIDDSHPALQGKVIEKKDFTWWDDKLDSNDYVGHGTHVAGIISGYWKNNTKTIFSGIAPEAELINYKVLDDWGWGLDSSIIKAIEESVDNKVNLISMSLGSNFGNPDDILSKVVDKAVKNEVIVVIAAGNIGWYGPFTIGSPGTARSGITVGAVDKNGTPAYFSSTGPLINGEIKPDIVAPGVNILSTCADKGFINCNYTNGKYFVALSGTSMATPHVTGAIALLLNVNKNLNPTQIKDLLKNGASSKYYPIIEGAGLIQVNKSYQLINGIIISPQSLYFGLIDNKEDKAINISFYNLGNNNKNILVKTPYYLYLETNNLTIPSNGKIDAKLYLNISSIKYVLDYPGFWLGFPYINTDRNISMSLGFIVPEILNLSYFSDYSNYSKQKSFEKGTYDYNWYELNILNNTEFLNVNLYDNNYTWADSILGVINPNMGIEYEEFAWWYNWDNGLYTNFQKYNPINGKWIFFTGTYNSNKEKLILDVSHPTFSTNFDYVKGSYGDIVTHNESIKNLIEYPLYSLITGTYDVLKNGKKITDSSQKITNAGSMLYFKVNITNITKGFVLNFKRKDNISYWDCKYFYVFIFDPYGNLWNKHYYWYYDSIYLCNSPYYSYDANKWVYNTTQGEWSIILVPSYYSNADMEYNADIGLNVYNLVSDNKWTLEKTKSITIDSGERKELLFETYIPEETESRWHLDIFESTLSIINWNKAGSFKIPIYIETFISNFLKINWPESGNYNNNKIYLSISSERNCSELNYEDLNNSQEKVNILCKNCNSINELISFKEGYHNLEIKCITLDGKIGKNKVLFFIDTKKPKISITNPKVNNFINGSGFFVKYDEDNLKTISLFYENDETSKENCFSGKNKICKFDLDIHNYDGQLISYYFMLKDIAGNTAKSKPLRIFVDTTPPEIKSLNYNVQRGSINFNLSVIEENLDKIFYSDNSGKLQVLCSRLNKNNECIARKSFKAGTHNLKIIVIDKAGNSAQREIRFEI